MRVRYRERARRDLGEIHHYLDARSPSGARNVLRAIYAGVQFIAENPDAAERTDDPSVRVKIVLRYRYKIFYSIAGDIIDVLHIRHAARRVPWEGER